MHTVDRVHTKGWFGCHQVKPQTRWMC